MDGLVIDDRTATVAQIATHYNQREQSSISEHTTLRELGYSSTSSHQVPLLSAKVRLPVALTPYKHISYFKRIVTCVTSYVSNRPHARHPQHVQKYKIYRFRI